MSESEKDDGDAALREALRSLASGPREQSSCGGGASRPETTVYVVTLCHHYEHSDLIDVGTSMEIGIALAEDHYKKNDGLAGDFALKWSEDRFKKGVMTTYEERWSKSYEVAPKTLKGRVDA